MNAHHLPALEADHDAGPDSRRAIDVHVGLAAIWAALRGARLAPATPAHCLPTDPCPCALLQLQLDDPMTTIGVGELIGLSDSQRQSRGIFVVRRAHRPADPGALHLWAEQLSPDACAVTLHPGAPIDEHKRFALLLPEAPRINRPTSLLTAVLPFEYGEVIGVEERHARLTVRPVRLLESMVDAQQLQFVPDRQPTV